MRELFNGFIVPIDAYTIDTVPESEAESEDSVDIHDLLKQYDWDTDVVPLLGLIPPRVADCIELRRMGKLEKSIGQIFDISKQAVSKLLKRGYSALELLLRRPKLTSEELRAILTPVLSERRIWIMLTLYDNPCKIQAARKVGLERTTLNDNFIASMKLIQASLTEESTQLQQLYDYFDWVIANKAYGLLVLHMMEKDDQPFDPEQPSGV